MNRKSQKPIALCRSQLKRRQPLLHLIPRLRFHRLEHGHHTMRPVIAVIVKTPLSAPFQYRPDRSNSSSSCSRASQSTKYSPCVTESPRSAPVYGLNSRSFLSAPFSAQTSIVGLRRVTRSPTRVIV